MHFPDPADSTFDSNFIIIPVPIAGALLTAILVISIICCTMYCINKKKLEEKSKEEEMRLNHELKLRQEELERDRDFKAQDAIGKTMEIISKLLDKTFSQMESAPEDLRNMYMEKINRYDAWIEDIAKLQTKTVTSRGIVRDDGTPITNREIFRTTRTSRGNIRADGITLTSRRADGITLTSMGNIRDDGTEGIVIIVTLSSTFMICMEVDLYT